MSCNVHDRFCRLYLRGRYLSSLPFSEVASECQTAWFKIRPDLILGLIWVQNVCTMAGILQEVFHVYLNKFKNDVTHLFLVILRNN